MLLDWGIFLCAIRIGSDRDCQKRHSDIETNSYKVETARPVQARRSHSTESRTSRSYGE
jgi:hypothetical protein